MNRALPPLRFRFAEADWEQYGSDWYDFDEQQLATVRARDLIALDDECKQHLRLTIVESLRLVLGGDFRAVLAVLWLTRRLAGHDDKLADFNPLAAGVEMKIVKTGQAGDAVPPDSSSSA
jgi:hypothetical protein